MTVGPHELEIASGTAVIMERDKPLREIFVEAAEIADDEARAVYLEKVCGGDAGLRKRVESLLAIEAAGDLPREAHSTDPDEADPLLGSGIGHYKVLERIGEGGCGVVYMAQQEKPVRRRVALKIIKLGMDTRQVVARFEAERQALAMMDHPGIAKVFEAGATEQGRPYFVMELVRGVPITNYCDQQQLGTRRRLELFTQVCQAVQHAHQKGIIHRDLKPSNVLVTEIDGIPQPRIIDFGIAKATEGNLVEATLFTAFDQLAGTPSYMSPEQASMAADRVDTRSDIYSLGVLLYELTTGEAPFDTKDLLTAGLDAMRRTISEKVPLRPSLRLSSMTPEEVAAVSQARGSDSPKLISQLAGDLDCITMKCLEKEPPRRYESAAALGADIKRHLADEPVLARPASRLYLLRKSFQRHKVVYAAAAAVVAALAAGVVLSSLQAKRARGAEREAREHAYAADLFLAHQSLVSGNFREAHDLLERHRPELGGADLRGWEWRYVWDQLRSDSAATLYRGEDMISAVATSSDGKFLAVGHHRDGGVTVWNLKTQERVASFPDVAGITQVTFAADAPHLAFSGLVAVGAGIGEPRAWVYDPAASRIVASLTLPAPCRGLALSHDGTRLVTNPTESQAPIVVWDVETGKPTAQLLGGQNDFTVAISFAASHDLRRAVQVSGQDVMRMVNLGTGAEIWRQPARRRATVAFSPDDRIVAASEGWNEPAIRLLDAATGREFGRVAGHQAWISSLVFAADGQTLYSASADQTIRVWDIRDPSRPLPVGILRGHTHEVWALTRLSGSEMLISGCKDGTVDLWTADNCRDHGAPITIAATVRSWCLAPDGDAVFTLDKAGHLQSWHGDQFQNPHSILEVPEHIEQAVFSDDARFLAAGSGDHQVRIWDLRSGQVRRTIQPDEGTMIPWAFRNDGSLLITHSRDHSQLHEWSVATGKRLRWWGVPEDIHAIAFSPDGRLCLQGTRSGELTLREMESGRERNVSPAPVAVDHVAFSPDGTRFAAASDFGLVRLWETDTLDEFTTLEGFPLGAHSVCFLADGVRLATGGSQRSEITLWDTRSKRKLLSLTGRGQIANEVAISADGTLMASLDRDGLLQVWRAPSWKEIEEVERGRAALPPLR